jgi:hypothetical protein
MVMWWQNSQCFTVEETGLHHRLFTAEDTDGFGPVVHDSLYWLILDKKADLKKYLVLSKCLRAYHPGMFA